MQGKKKKRISTQKSVVFLYITTDQSFPKIEKIIPSLIASKRMKYLGIDLTKETKDLYKTLLKENPK